MSRKDVDPFDTIRRLRYETNEIAVGFSCGKDSVATLDLCCEWFDRVLPFYMFIIPGLSFHRQYIAYMAERYASKCPRGIVEVPHWALSRRFQHAALRPDEYRGRWCPKLNLRDVELKIAKEYGYTWFAYGIKKADSLERRAMLNKDSGIILASHRGFPLADWSHRAVTQYLRSKNLPLSPEYAYMGRSYGGALEGEELDVMEKHFPGDWQRILERFPYAEAELFRWREGMVNRAKMRAEA